MCKQYIIIRKDLNMRKGKMVAQGAHASNQLFIKKFKNFWSRIYFAFFGLPEEEKEWMFGNYKKIVLGVDSLEELLNLQYRCEAKNLECYLITDSGLTEFTEPTITCLAVGPKGWIEAQKIMLDASLEMDLKLL